MTPQPDLTAREIAVVASMKRIYPNIDQYIRRGYSPKRISELTGAPVAWALAVKRSGRF